MRKIQKRQIGGAIAAGLQGLDNAATAFKSKSPWQIELDKKKLKSRNKARQVVGIELVEESTPTQPKLFKLDYNKIAKDSDNFIRGWLQSKEQLPIIGTSKEEPKENAIVSAINNTSSNVLYSDDLSDVNAGVQPVLSPEEIQKLKLARMNNSTLQAAMVLMNNQSNTQAINKNGNPNATAKLNKKGGILKEKYQLGGALGSMMSGMGGGASGLSGAVNGLTSSIGNMIGDRPEMNGKYGNITAGMDAAYDGVLQALGSIPGPFGQIASMAMGANKMLGKAVGKIGGGTDGMTKGDAILGSPFLNMTPLGLINGFGGSKSHTLNDVTDQTKMLYGLDSLDGFGGTLSQMTEGSGYSNKKYGLFSSKLRKLANKMIDTLNSQLIQMLDIASAASDAFDIQNSMASVNQNATAFNLNGGYKQSTVHVGKHGFKFSDKSRQFAKNVISAKKGTKVQKELQEESKYPNRDFPLYSRFIDYLKETGKDINEKEYDLKGFYDDPELYSKWEEAEYISPGKAHMPDKYKLSEHITYSTDAKDADPEKAGIWSGSDEEGWTFTPSAWQLNKFGQHAYVDYFNKYEPEASLILGNNVVIKHLKGGQMNVIPEGALHAHLHHMENGDKITKKGIPVIDNNGNQLAEIERNEIIFTLDVTKKLEELLKKYNESSGKEKDSYAIEAGKLLTEEILENTDDRTGLLKTI